MLFLQVHLVHLMAKLGLILFNKELYFFLLPLFRNLVYFLISPTILCSLVESDFVEKQGSSDATHKDLTQGLHVKSLGVLYMLIH